MKWILCTEDFPPNFIGGVASWAHDLATALSNQGEDVVVFARNTTDSKEFDSQSSFPVRRIKGRSWGQHKAKWVRLALQGVRGDIVLFATWELATLAAPYVHKRGIRVGIAVHGSDITRANIPIARLQQVAKFVHHWFPVSHFLSQEFYSVILY